MMQEQTTTGLIADIGGTNARFSLVSPGVAEAQSPLVLACGDYPGLAEAAEAYLEAVAPPVRPRHGAFAIASPVLGDQIAFTNSNWSFSISALRDRLELERLEVVNDFTAVALSVPLLADEDKVAVGGGVPTFGAPIAILGPGTGLGVATLMAAKTGWRPIPTEGGHATMAAVDEKEASVLAWLRGRFGHVSAERVLSGPGLTNLHQAISDLAGRPTSGLAPHEVSKLALEGDALAIETQDMFFSMLGTFTGNLALLSGARGGVVIAGGIVPHLLDAFLASAFRRRFEDKGRFRSYLEAIPVHVITHRYPAFIGLRGLIG
ncbi:glucokinase [Telmatospirillum sp.]|uniref:glucokinase n=1 Tax=Telmatospirillum sp. TaxID=2079197 RepID=UPI00285106A8|nr:glucokinase [Telmatospirillum sp.]MDR3440049.1 glucokinase [Telmatospirillum sp.]